MPRKEGNERANLGAQTEDRDRNSDMMAGDEGIDDGIRADDDVVSSRNMKSSDRNVRSNERTQGDGSFSGQGSQKDGSDRNAEGTGYTGNSQRQLQEDDSLSGTQGRHGKSGSRHGKSGTSDQERTGGQTAQNPRGDK